MISAQENARVFRSFSTCAARASSWPACDTSAHSACSSVSCSAQKPRCRVSAIWAAPGSAITFAATRRSRRCSSDKNVLFCHGESGQQRGEHRKSQHEDPWTVKLLGGESRVVPEADGGLDQRESLVASDTLFVGTRNLVRVTCRKLRGFGVRGIHQQLNGRICSECHVPSKMHGYDQDCPGRV